MSLYQVRLDLAPPKRKPRIKRLKTQKFVSLHKRNPKVSDPMLLSWLHEVIKELQERQAQNYCYSIPQGPSGTQTAPRTDCIQHSHSSSSREGGGKARGLLQLSIPEFLRNFYFI